MKKDEFVEFEGGKYKRTNTEICFHNFETGYTYPKDPAFPEDLINRGYVEIDKNILPVVVALNKKGFKTSHSCGGHLLMPDIDTIKNSFAFKKLLEGDIDYIDYLFDMVYYVNIDHMYISFQDIDSLKSKQIFSAFNNCTRCNIYKRINSIADWNYDKEACEECNKIPREGIKLVESLSIYAHFQDSCPYIMDGYFKYNDKENYNRYVDNYKEAHDEIAVQRSLLNIVDYMQEKIGFIKLQYDLWQQDMIMQMMKAVDQLFDMSE